MQTSWMRGSLLSFAALLFASTALLSSLACRTVRAADATAVTPISLGNAAVALDGPWKFHVGDNARWSAPDFDDSAWELVDLTPPAGAHDDDVGLTGYV